MIWMDRLFLFSPFDYAGLLLLGLSWAAIGWLIEHSPTGSPSTSRLMAGYRRSWMQEMITRQPRVFDAQIVASLRQGTAFFASTTMLALGGAIALLGNADRLTQLAGDLIEASEPVFVWEVRIATIGIFLLNAFLKFVWSNRLFGYASVLMAAVPNDESDPTCAHKAGQAGEMVVLAALSFNRGLRSVYFALAATAWLAGPLALMLATLVTLAVIWRREFASRARKVLLNTG